MEQRLSYGNFILLICKEQTSISMTLHLIYLIQSSHPLHYEVAVHSKGETRFLRRQSFSQGFEFIPAGPLQANMPG